MVEIGKYNTLRVVKEVDFGVYLDGGKEWGEILLPSRYVPESCAPDDMLEVFIYFDSQDRIIATTLHPYLTAGEFGFLTVKTLSTVGAFLDWGLMKDVLAPFREQKMPMEAGRSYLVYVYLDDESERIVASARIEQYLDNTPPEYKYNEEVDLLVTQELELGYRVIINNLHTVMIYHNEIFTAVQRGDRLKGYIKQIRPDEKIDVALQPMGYDKIDGLAGEIMDKLRRNGGTLAISDSSPAEDIVRMFGCSKKNFKKAIGSLYKTRSIVITSDSISILT